MPRNISGAYYLPAGSIVATGDDNLPPQHNDPLQDIAADLNAARPISSGGTAATTVSGAIENLGLSGIVADAATVFPSTAAFLASSTAFAIGSRISARTGQVWDVVAAGTGQYNHPVSGIGLNEIPSFLKADGSVFVGTVSPNTQDGQNVGLGRNVMRFLTKDAGQPLQRGVGNVGIGTDVMSAAGLSADYNTAVGFNALMDLTTGYCNSAFGLRTLSNLTDAQYNTALGCDAGLTLTTGDDNVIVGAKAMLLATTAYSNVAVGNGALGNGASGYDNVAVGTQALYDVTTGFYNVAVGSLSGENITTGQRNTFLGAWSGRLVTTGSRNVFIGDGTGGSATTASDCVLIGRGAGQTLTTTSGMTGVGADALSVATGANNTALGNQAGYNTSTGTGNTYVGKGAGFANTTGSNNSALGDSALSSNAAFTGCTGLGYNAQVTGNNQLQLGDSSTTSYSFGAVVNRSDARDKADIRDTALGLDFIVALRPVDFRWDYRDDYGRDADGNFLPGDGSKKRKRYHHGLIAQEVRATMEAMGVDFGGFKDHTVTGGMDVLSIGYEELIGPMIKAIQQLSARVAELEGAA